MMTRAEFIEAYSSLANRLLTEPDPENHTQVVYDAMRSRCMNLPELQALLEQLHHNFKSALQPSEFFNSRTRAYDEEFFKIYALMRREFDSEILEEMEAYQNSFPKTWLPDKPPTMVMVGRFWQVSGRHQYDIDGKLRTFVFDTETVTTEATATISGSYVSMASVGRKEAIGGVGYAVTRKAFRGLGHGVEVSARFEQEMRESANARGEQLRLMLVESEASARPFWSRCGYRWPKDCFYIQPPISFDPRTGEPNFPPVPETLMVKVMDNADDQVVERDLLFDALKTLFQKWFGVPDGTPEAQQRANALIFDDILPKIFDSLRPAGEFIPLVDPPKT